MSGISYCGNVREFSRDDDSEIDLYVEAVVSPAIPAPRCSNPDSPAFSDPGAPAECDIISVEDVNGNPVELTPKELRRLCNGLIDCVTEDLEQSEDADGDAAYDLWAEERAIDKMKDN